MNKSFTLILTILLILTGVYYYTKQPAQAPANPPIATTPTFIQQLISKQEADPIANPPASLSKCTYKNQTVYYLPPRCCDIPGILYNEKGENLCSPDGGITGRGNGKCTDFFQTKEKCEIIWQDSRSK